MTEPLKVKIRKVDSLAPYWRNPRKNDDTVDALAESITRYGFTQPIVIDPEGTIVAGHTRYKAALKLGLATVPTVTIGADLAREYRIVDNAVGAQSDWDIAKLIPELRALELDMQPFFGDELDVAAILRDTTFSADPVTNAGMAGADDALAGQFATGDATKFIGITCPHCGGDFNIKEADFHARPSGSQ